MTDLFQTILKSGSGLRVRATGSSMTPFIRNGEVVTIRKTGQSSLRRGDIIFYRNSQGLPVLHRLIRRDSKAHSLLSKGDALRYFDKPVSSEDVMGRVCLIEKGRTFAGLRRLNLDALPWRAISCFIAYATIIRAKWARTASRLTSVSRSA